MIEPKRGCGFRTVDGLYLMSDGVSFSCDRLTFEIDEICRCCGGGTKFSRGWTWVNPDSFFNGDHYVMTSLVKSSESEVSYAPGPPQEVNCDCLGGRCPVCRPLEMGSPAALLWIGEKHYSPEDFKKEAAEMGVSKKIPAVPRDLEVGKTWVLCAHKKAVRRDATPTDPDHAEFQYFPGVFFAFQPTRIERVVKQSDLDLFEAVDFMPKGDREQWIKEKPSLIDRWNLRKTSRSFNIGDWESNVKTYAKMARDKKRGITFVPVPDDDPDHNPEVKK